MTKRMGLSLLVLMLAVGCATTKEKTKKIVVWEDSKPSQTYEVIGPVSVTEEISEGTEDTIQGLAGFMKDGVLSDQIPAETKVALEAKKMKYKDMIFEKLGKKAQDDYGAEAVIEAQYSYVPPFASLSRKAIVTAKGTMIQYKK